MKFSVIVPVYNRIDEVSELLDSLRIQTSQNFEVIIVEDGSTEPCEEIVAKAVQSGLDAKYYYKVNEGRSIARNHGMERASGDYFIFFDSDCVIPPDYFCNLEKSLNEKYFDCFGGPDAAHESFSDTQKAINYTMTSLLTTGGIRGGKISLEKFVPRTFNMGFSRGVYNEVGGFREMFSEDIDMSTRIRQKNYTIGLIQNPVWHKRRVDFKKFFRQVYVFGMSRITLQLLYPGSLKLVHTLPAFFVLGSLLLVILGLFVDSLWLLPLALYFFALWIDAMNKTGNVKIALMAIPAAIIQLGGYGLGFIKSYVTKILLGKGRNLEEEIEIRKGK